MESGFEPWLVWTLSFLLGLVTAVFNVVGGGGSLLTIPAMVELGLSPQAANATNRIGVVMQSLSSTATLLKRRQVATGLAGWLSVFALAGAIIGVWLAIIMDEDQFRLALAILFALMGLNLLWAIFQASGAPAVPNVDASPTWKLGVAFFFVGIYGGFIQAGVGIVILLVLSNLTQMDLRRSNGVKVLVVLVFTCVSLTSFLILDSSLIHWVEGLVFGAGAMAGGWLGARYNEVIPIAAIRWILVVAVFAASARFAGLL